MTEGAEHITTPSGVYMQSAMSQHNILEIEGQEEGSPWLVMNWHSDCTSGMDNDFLSTDSRGN